MAKEYENAAATIVTDEELEKQERANQELFEEELLNNLDGKEENLLNHRLEDRQYEHVPADFPAARFFLQLEYIQKDSNPPLCYKVQQNSHLNPFLHLLQKNR